jgi:hypothetical protein
MAPEVWRGSVEVEATESVFDLLERLIDDYPRNGPLLPFVVLQAAESDRPGVLERRVREIVHSSRRPGNHAGCSRSSWRTATTGRARAPARR